jgi:uncharacterized protein YjbI with pentapeptide repeats
LEHTSTDNGICGCKPEYHSACYGAARYIHQDKKQYCILHLPTGNKGDDFKDAIKSKLRQRDFNFRGTVFPDDTSEFKGFTFDDNVSFTGATFWGNADFTSTQFNGARTDFSYAQFSGERTYFSGTQFSSKRTSFSDAQFSGKSTNFSSAVFSGKQKSRDKQMYFNRT